MTLYLPVLLGTVRADRQTGDVARYAHERLAKRPGVETQLFDPCELPFGNLVRREWNMDPRPAEVETFVREMDRADGFVVVTPEYNHGYPGALKNVLDHLYDEWGRKPFGLVTTGGGMGGVRAAEALRVVVGALGAVSVPRSVPVPKVGDAFGPDGPTGERERWEKRFDRFFEDVEWYARALQAARRAGQAGASAKP